MRVSERAQAKRFFALILAPDLPEGDEEALLRSKTVDRFLVSGSDRILQCYECDANTAIVGDIFPECELAIQINTGNRAEFGVLLGHAGGVLVERFGIGRSP